MFVLCAGMVFGFDIKKGAAGKFVFFYRGDIVPVVIGVVIGKGGCACEQGGC